MQDSSPLPPSLIVQYVITRRSVIGMIDAGIAYYRSAFSAFFGLTLLAWLPYYALKYLMFRLDVLPFERITGSFEIFQTASYSATNLFFFFIDFLALIFAGGLISRAAYENAAGKPAPVFRIAKSMIRYAHRFLFYSVLIAAAILFSGLCFFPGVWLFIFFIISTPLLAVEMPAGFGTFLSRNRLLMKNEWFRSLGFFLLTFFLLLILGISLTYLFYGLYQIIIDQISWLSGILPDYQLLDMFSGVIVSLLLFPLQTIFNTFLYFDIRSRKEGFDLEYLVNHL